MFSTFVPDEQSMLNLGSAFASELRGGDVIYFVGDLGAGKTTFVKGIVRGIGFYGNVTSPTYTLVESYEHADFTVYHFDLYRLDSPDDLEFLGIRDMVGRQSVILVEWPDKGIGVLPSADLVVEISYQDNGRTVRFSAKDSIRESHVKGLIENLVGGHNE